MESLRNKVVIVTGAGSGIGLSTTQALQKYGAKIYAVDISPIPEVLAESEKLKFHQVDLSSPGAPDDIVSKCLSVYGTVNVLLNVAGVMDAFGSVDTLTDKSWDRTIAINLTAPVKLMRAVIPSMLKAGSGSIVNVASKAALSGSTAGVAYVAAKTGLVGATKNVAYRFSANKIRCNAICPGGVETNITKSVLPADYDLTALGMSKPVHDIGQTLGYSKPDAQANVLIFLASDLSSDINGAIIPASCMRVTTITLPSN